VEDKLFWAGTLASFRMPGRFLRVMTKAVAKPVTRILVQIGEKIVASMPQTCSICRHDQRLKIEQALVAGTSLIRDPVASDAQHESPRAQS
jgi:hypothetical protein